MDMKTLLLYGAVVALAAGLAVLVFSEPATSDSLGDREVVQVDDPAWYRTASFGTRLAALKKRLALMTSRAIAPEQTGPVKDDIALLCRDEALVDVVIDSFESHPHLTSALLSAYMEIFGRVKNPKFTPLLKRGFESPEFEVRMNAAAAGMVHGSARSIEEIGQALLVSSGAQAGSLLATLLADGGGNALHWVEAVIAEREEEGLLIPSLRAMGDARYMNAIPTIRRRLKHPSAAVEIAAAAALAIMGQQDGYQYIRNLAMDEKASPLARAEAVQVLHTVAGGKNKELFRKLASRKDAAGFESRLVLLKLRDPEMIKQLRSKALGKRGLDKVQAAGALGASGVEEDAAFLAEHVDEFDVATLRAVIESLKRGRPKNAGRFIANLAALKKPEAGLAYRAFSQYGEDALDDLARVLAKETDPERRDLLLRAASLVPCEKSLAILQSVDAGDDRDLWMLVRSLIRKVDLGILKK